jgi:transcriptional regulator with XRE-family HTH domain
MSNLPTERLHIGRTWKAGRLLSGKTQSQLAQEIGIPQSSISKYENFSLEPSASDWFRFCQHIGIDAHRTLNLGYIDGRLKFKEKVFSQTLFKLPLRYRKDFSLKIRELLPFRQCVISELGENSWNELLTIMGLDAEMFYVLDLQVSLSLLSDIIIWAEGQGLSLMEKVYSFSADLKFHGSLFSEYQRKKSSVDLLKSITDQQAYYQRVLELEFVQESSSVSVNFSIRKELENFFDLGQLELFQAYKARAFMSFIEKNAQDNLPGNVIRNGELLTLTLETA